MRIHAFTFNPFQENTYLLLDDSTHHCAIVDPGCHSPAEEAELRAYLDQHGFTPTALLLTHSHIDHVFGLDFVVRTWHLTPHHHPADEQSLRQVPLYAPLYGFPRFRIPDVTPLHLPTSGPVRFGNVELEVRFTPGHSPGHVVFYHAPTRALIGGDVLFQNSIGRTDLPGGSFSELAQSIRHQLYSLPDDVTVYPGHGPTTTIGQEKRTNPFVPAT
ncbi:MAG TPA: MBL fold metallo-hydrolase [bacterium]|nr:MBL fold metallo-hydrolase [bacterium]